IPTFTWKKEGADLVLLDYNRAADRITQGKIGEWVGVSAAAFYDDRPDIVQDLHACLNDQIPIERQYEYRFRSTGELHFLAVKYAFAPPDLVLVHTEDMDERVRIEAQLIKRINELHALHRITQILTSTSDLTQALELICQTMCTEFDVRTVFILLKAQDDDGLHSLVGYDRTRGALIRSQEQTQHYLAQLPENIYSAEKSKIYTNLQALNFAPSTRKFIQAMNLHTALAVSLMARNAPLGLFVAAKENVATKENVAAKENAAVNENGKAAFTTFDIRLAETIAADIAAAIENDRLQQQARQAAVAAERQRLARDLHDSVTQSIYSLTLFSSGWESLYRRGALDDPAGSFRLLREIAQQALKEMRLLIHQLRPSVLEQSGLASALEQRLKNVEQRAQIQVEFRTQGDLSALSPRVETELFNIAQEAQNNSVRHAQAQQVVVALTEDQSALTLFIADDGRGFDPDTAQGGLGLGNMRARAQAISAGFTLEAAPDRGVAITVSVPREKAKK
ncbi:MAG TPA: sensor histidine kinase, partial [Anaerolineales bacterium]|nr:sensor histidine kinase [Anaerolineales bacterium]